MILLVVVYYIIRFKKKKDSIFYIQKGTMYVFIGQPRDGKKIQNYGYESAWSEAVRKKYLPGFFPTFAVIIKMTSKRQARGAHKKK